MRIHLYDWEYDCRGLHGSGRVHLKDWGVGAYVRAVREWKNAPVKGYEWENANMKG